MLTWAETTDFQFSPSHGKSHASPVGSFVAGRRRNFQRPMNDMLAPEDIEISQLRQEMLVAEQEAVRHERAAERARRRHMELRSKLEDVLASRYP